ncbi:protein adenylyltransferase SelO [Desulfomarina sp.]
MNISLPVPSLDDLTFNNRFFRDLPGDPVLENSRRQVRGACYSSVTPRKASSPRLLAFSPEVARLLGISIETCRSNDFTEVFVGNRLLAGMNPYAMCYGGHQFGNWAGQLGDGRAINLGEVDTGKISHWTLQLKGAGPTPYSRSADGLAVLRSSLREFLCSEAMHHLGIPTTRALSLISTGDQVTRDMFYDGHPKKEPGAVVCRVAPSFIRFGNFELPASRKETDLLKQLVDFTIRTDFPHLGKPSTATYLQWYNEICERTATLLVHWMRVGFVHGVMNSDNMSITGLTIDYGPYGWLENFDPNWTPNTTDSQGRRYCFKNQPHIGQWNLLQLANAIYPLINDTIPLQEALNLYTSSFQEKWNLMMAKKLGLKTFQPQTDDTLIHELTTILQSVETDMTIFFRNLAEISPIQENDQSIPVPLRDAYYLPEQINKEYTTRLSTWLRKYRKRLQEDEQTGQERTERMNRTNPKYILRNYLAQQAIDKAENGDTTMIEELQNLIRHPYDEQPDKKHFAQKRPEWARNRPGCSMLSCSS